jgi:deazaflavin-dependent oxidoreductase (nitroreductase family)
MRFPRSLSRYTRGFAGAVALRLAGHLAFADLEHVGRKSGLARHTPVRAFRVHNNVVIGLNFGREVDWLKNIQAAGGCRVRLGGELLELGAPRVVSAAHGVQGTPWIFRFAVTYLVRTAECVELPITTSRPILRPC